MTQTWPGKSVSSLNNRPSKGAPGSGIRTCHRSNQDLRIGVASANTPADVCMDLDPEVWKDLTKHENQRMIAGYVEDAISCCIHCMQLLILRKLKFSITFKAKP